jgi:hypothetical protein
MAQAITTRYLGTTAARGSRMLAVAFGGRATVAYDYELDIDGNHAAAAAALCRKLGWDAWEPRGHGVLASGDHVWVSGSAIAPAEFAREAFLRGASSEPAPPPAKIRKKG